MIKYLFDDGTVASATRTVIRAVLVCVTAFGVGLDAAQVASVQVLAEAVLQLGREINHRRNAG